MLKIAQKWTETFFRVKNRSFYFSKKNGILLRFFFLAFLFFLHSNFPTEFLPDSYRIPSEFLPDSYWISIGFLPNSYRIPTKFLPEKYQIPTEFLSDSYRKNTESGRNIFYQRKIQIFWPFWGLLGLHFNVYCDMVSIILMVLITRVVHPYGSNRLYACNIAIGFFI